ncbi:hypothetical protein [Methylobacterium sp. SI9]|uniref:hypothetical protein n=1 Tax=Methylobacterium guangdongense TaxID=3138811 RepID=UPI00313E9B35
MPAGYGPTAVIDTADWDIVVPLLSPFDPTGSRLEAAISPGMGGPAIATVSTDDGSLAWMLNQTGKAVAVNVHVPVAARDGWQAAQKTVLGFDFHRTVVGSTKDEWFGAQTITFQVYPASDSALAMLGAGFLYGGRPAASGKATTPPLQIGPQGPPGPQGPAGGGGSGADPQLSYSIAAAASFTANHGRSYRPAVALLLPSGEQVETDVYHAPGQVTVVFAQPFTGTLLLG